MPNVSAEDLLHLAQVALENKGMVDTFASMRETMSPAEWDLYEELQQKDALEEQSSGQFDQTPGQPA